MVAAADLPYRRNVGAVLFNRDGLVFLARRADFPPEPGAWQLPQGGIDEGETPREAVLRELEEEIGTARAEIIGEHPDWLRYDLPAELIGRALGGKYRGQMQRWFALRFAGADADIRLDRHAPAEFDAWKWTTLSAMVACAVPFKRDICMTLARSFAPFAAPVPRL